MNAISSEHDVRTKVEIQTFVFFDLETTGFIRGSTMPKITELSLVASSRASLFSKDGSLPRVMHKLTIPLQPLIVIPLIVSEITGLYNDLLEHEKPFDEQIFELVNSFISRLCPPICFVAHNGNRFDYPIFLSELNRIGKTLSEDILCIDSLDVFKTLFSLNKSNKSEKRISSKTTKEDLNLLDDDWNTALAAIAEPDTISSMSVEIEGVEAIREIYETDPQSIQKVNETTPTHQINRLKVFVKSKELSAKKRLPFTHTSGPVNFKLDTIYQHLVGAAPCNSHSAEDDCLTLLICVMKIGDPFICWADLNARPLARYAIKQEY